MKKVEGVGPDAPVMVNEKGAKQSEMGYLFTDFMPEDVLAVAAVSARGSKKYGPRNWSGIEQTNHLNHALTHIFAYSAGDRQENHLPHAIWETI